MPFVEDAVFFEEAFFALADLVEAVLEDVAFVESSPSFDFAESLASAVFAFVFLVELFFVAEALFACVLFVFFVLLGFFSEASLLCSEVLVAFGTRDSFRQKPYLDIASP